MGKGVPRTADSLVEDFKNIKISVSVGVGVFSLRGQTDIPDIMYV